MYLAPENQKQWLKQFQVQDLSRSLVRQFLIQNHLSETLNSFENEDTKMHKKIHKSILIKILSMNNLVYYNKQQPKPLKSLLEILVGYLKNKFKNKLQMQNNESEVNTKKTQLSNLQNNSKDNESQKAKAQKSMNNTFNLSNKQRKSHNNKQQILNGHHHKHKNQRPVTSGHRGNTKNVELIYAQLAKQDLKAQQRLKKIQKDKQILEEDRKRKQREQIEKRRKEVQQHNKKKIEEQKLKQIQRQKIKQKQQFQIQQKRLQQIQIQRKKEKQRQIQQERQKQQQQEKERQKQKQRQKQRQRLKLQQQRKQKQRLEQKIKEEKQKKQRQQQQLKQKQQKERKEQQLRHIKQQKIKIQKAKKQEEMKAQMKRKQQNSLSNNVNNELKGQIYQQTDKIAQSDKGQTRMTGMRKMVKKKQKQPQPDLILQSKEIIIQQPKKIQQPNFILASEKPTKENISKQLQNAKSEQEKKDEGQKMVTMFGRKKKLNNEKGQQNEPKKFKFDQNFVDEPLRAQTQQYQYQKIQLNKITICKQAQGQINYKQKYAISNKKFAQKAITEAQAQQLKKAVFQGGPSVLPKSWFQGFILSPFASTPYGLQQIEGGPCGIIAAIQCYYLKHFLHLAKLTEQEMSIQHIRQNCLVAAITDMLMKCKSSDKIILALPPKSFSGTKIDLSNLKLVTIDANTFAQAFQGVYQYKSYFIGKTNHGVSVLMYSIVMTKGVDKIWQEIDIKQNPLIGHHGHCTQQLVNLFITGKASSNCFDGTKILDSQLKLQGIEQKSQFGFLTIFETLKYIQVGHNLKNPVYPFWIICKQFHYHVIFCNHYLIAENNMAEKFDVVYFDGLYNCADRIVITMERYAEKFGEEVEVKVKDLPLIQQVMMTKWGKMKADWNGSIRIL